MVISERRFASDIRRQWQGVVYRTTHLSKGFPHPHTHTATHTLEVHLGHQVGRQQPQLPYKVILFLVTVANAKNAVKVIQEYKGHVTNTLHLHLLGDTRGATCIDLIQGMHVHASVSVCLCVCSMGVGHDMYSDQ